jgi:hypothetical protein
MRQSFVACVFGLSCAAVLAGCGLQQEAKDETSSGTEAAPATFLGPIPEDYQNTLAAADLARAGADEATSLRDFGAGFALADSKAGGRAANGADPSLPNLNECEALHQLLAATLVPREITGIDPTPNLALLRGYRCSEMAAAIGASLFDVPGAVGYAARQFRSFDAPADGCAAFTAVDPNARTASSFAVAKHPDGAYLARFPSAGLTGAFEGGGNASTLALRTQASLRATSGTGRHLFHDVAIATLVDRGVRSARTQRLETIEVRDGAGDPAHTESLSRDVHVTFSYGDDRSMHEETHVTRVTAARGEEQWTLSVDAEPVVVDGAVQSLSMTMKLAGVGADRSLTLPCQL